MIKVINPFNRNIDDFNTEATKTGCRCMCDGDAGNRNTGYNSGFHYDYPTCGGGCGCRCVGGNSSGNSSSANNSSHS